MLRRLLAWRYLIGVTVVFGGALFVSHQYQSASSQCAKECDQVHPGNLSPSSSAKDCQECQEYAERHLPRWYRLFGWPEGITTWAILLTLLAIAEQTHQTKRAAEASRDSIRLQQAEMAVTINKERPYLVVSAEAVGPGEFVLRAQNKGKTPARIASVWYRPLVTKRSENLEIPPDEKTADSLISHLPLLLPPEGTLMIFKWGVTEMKDVSLPPISSLHFYARIRYFNTLEPAQVKAYETRCLYWAVPIDGRPPIPDPRYPEHNTWT